MRKWNKSESSGSLQEPKSCGAVGFPGRRHRPQLATIEETGVPAARVPYVPRPPFRIHIDATQAEPPVAAVQELKTHP
jgi:hypothetical protein